MAITVNANLTQFVNGTAVLDIDLLQDWLTLFESMATQSVSTGLLTDINYCITELTSDLAASPNPYSAVNKTAINTYDIYALIQTINIFNYELNGAGLNPNSLEDAIQKLRSVWNSYQMFYNNSGSNQVFIY